MIIVLGSVAVRPEHRDAAMALGLEHCARSRAEPGCLSHACFVAPQEPDRLQFVETWRDMAALRSHFAVPDSAMFVRRLSTYAREAPEMRIFEAAEIAV